MHPYSRFAGLPPEGEVLAALCIEMLMGEMVPRGLLSYRTAGGRWCRRHQRGEPPQAANSPKCYSQRIRLMLSIKQTSPSGGSGAQHQKGCISNGRSPVVWFSISRSEILKLIARRAIPHPLNLLNFLNPLNPSRRAAPMGVHFQRAKPGCLVFHFVKRTFKTHRSAGAIPPPSALKGLSNLRTLGPEGPIHLKNPHAPSVSQGNPPPSEPFEPSEPFFRPILHNPPPSGGHNLRR